MLKKELKIGIMKKAENGILTEDNKLKYFK